MGRDTSDEAYVLTLCDRVLGEVGSRQRRFGWLQGDPGRTGRRVRLPVDGYWAAAHLVLEYRERQHYQPVPHSISPNGSPSTASTAGSKGRSSQWPSELTQP